MPTTVGRVVARWKRQHNTSNTKRRTANENALAKGRKRERKCFLRPHKIAEKENEKEKRMGREEKGRKSANWALSPVQQPHNASLNHSITEQ